ncbi:MAG TPA: CheR family methyltransferase [Anaeromyxobacter sp.]|nr:CheR family methyltransferase [Anaeromyxobacter sp.]
MVGIGASAGGLDALERLFSELPADSGLAFVVVHHQDPRHPNTLANLLGRCTRMPVSKAQDRVRPEPNQVYAMAPKTLLSVQGGALRVAASSEGASAGRIDAFLSSLAKDRGENAAGVVLSGAGSDGIAGLRAIKDRGGLALAQDPKTTARGGLAHPLVEAGLADRALPVEEMPSALVAWARHLAFGKGAAGTTIDADLAGNLGAICEVLRRGTGHDFSHYKQGTLLRRIRRRLHAHRAASASDYLRVLERDPAEPRRLVKDLLIGVTQFFRDPDSFAALARQVLPTIMEGTPVDVPIRIWVPGCASGEEAYSLAILVHEHFRRQGTERRIQIFATDVDPETIAQARAGLYPSDIAEDVSSERLKRFFVHEGSSWQVGSELREACVFSLHSLIRDPPFSGLDLVSCRNVLIYLQPDLEKKIIPLFHYALRSGGYLFLGPAEALPDHSDLFQVVDKKHRIFRRRETLARPRIDLSISARPLRRFEPPASAPPARTARQGSAAAIERMLLDDYTPPCAVVNERGEIEFVAGRIGRFLAPPAGAPASNLLDAVRDSLRRELRTSLRAAVASGGRIVRDGVPVELEDGVRRVRLTVRPVPGSEGLFAVVIQERALEPGEQTEAAGPPAVPPALEQIETELRSTRADLKAAIESAETANEELRSTNEELTSTNEELQSANGRLQGSKEELQSLNEELETVNAELQRKVDELGLANSDLQNLFTSTQIATVFLDREMRIARFTPAAMALLHLLEGDIGRPIADFAPRFEGFDLVADAGQVLATETPIERQVRLGRPPRWFILRLLPYRTAENLVAGAVVTFADVSDLKRAEDELRAARERAEWLASFPAKNPIPIAEIDADGRVRYANVAAERLFPDLYALGSLHPWLRGWDEVVRVFRGEGTAATAHERIVAIGERSFEQHMYSVPETGCIRIYAVDVTERRRVEEALRESEERYSVIFDKAPFAIALTKIPEGTFVSVNDAFLRLFEFAREDLIGKTSVELRLSDAEDQARVTAEFRERGSVRDLEVSRTTRSGARIVLSLNLERISIGGQEFVLSSIQDITARKRAETDRERVVAELDATLACLPDGVAVYKLDGSIAYMNPAGQAITGFLADGWKTSTAERIERLRMAREDGTAYSPDQTPAARALRGETVPSEVMRLRRIGGPSLWISSGAAPIVSSHGERIGAVGAFSDITALKRAEEAVVRSRAGLSRLADASLSVIRETGLEDMLRAISEAALALTGARCATSGHGYVGGRFTVSGSARAPDAPDCPPGNMFALEKGGIQDDLAAGTDVIRLTDEKMRTHPRWWGLPEGHVPLRGLLGVRLADRNGKTNGVILVTDKKDGEFTEEDESLLRQLAMIASLALQHVEARISLEESDRSKNHFLAVLSHELRNPLAPIRNSLYLLDRTPPGSEQANRAHRVIDRQVGHLTRLVDDLLDATRISRGKIQLRRERLDLSEVVRRAAEDHLISFANASIELRVLVPPAPLFIVADGTRVTQVVGNLLENSLKFTERGGSATVRVEEDESGREATLRVLDTGAGIARAALPRVFEPFMQADTTLDRSKGGLGLGLSLVKGLVEMHGGTVSIHSEGEGRGTEVTVRLPLDAGEKATSGPPRPSTRSPRRVLVIEDNPDAASSVRDLLELTNHTVAVALSGREGIEKARTFKPDVVLCDIGLPGMDGYEVARAFRSDSDLRGSVLVALTGYAAPEDLARVREAGFDVHVAKPASPEVLEEALSADPPKDV